MAGNYRVRNTAYARFFLRRWADFYFLRPRGYHSSDQGAIHQLILEEIGSAKAKECRERYERQNGGMDHYYRNIVGCARAGMGWTQSWPSVVRRMKSSSSSSVIDFINSHLSPVWKRQGSGRELFNFGRPNFNNNYKKPFVSDRAFLTEKVLQSDPLAVKSKTSKPVQGDLNEDFPPYPYFYYEADKFHIHYPNSNDGAGHHREGASGVRGISTSDASDSGGSLNFVLSGRIRILPRFHSWIVDGFVGGSTCQRGFHPFHHGIKQVWTLWDEYHLAVTTPVNYLHESNKLAGNKNQAYANFRMGVPKSSSSTSSKLSKTFDNVTVQDWSPHQHP